MTTTEDRLRRSLTARSEDVTATSALWPAIDRRITRHRRRRQVGLALAGATAVLLAVVAVPAVLGVFDTPVQPLGPIGDLEPDPTPTPAPDPDPTPDPAPAPDADPAPAPAPDADPAPDPAPDPARAAGLPDTPVVVVVDRELRLVGPSGSRTLHVLPAEGESSYLTASVRPGSTPDDLVVVSLTTAEGFTDLRWLEVVDGEVVVAGRAFEGAAAPATARTTEATVSRPVWSPDGDTLAWFETTADGSTLRTVGWGDGPGTGDPATDNAAFGLGDRTGRTPVAWVPAPGQRAGQPGPSGPSGELATHLLVTGAADGWEVLAVDRQADGAWSLPAGQPTLQGQPDPSPERGAILTLTPPGRATPSGTDAGELRVLRRDGDGVRLEVLGPPARLLATLPGDLPADADAGVVLGPDGPAPSGHEGRPALWLRAVGDTVIVGNAWTSAAWLVTADGQVTTLAVPATDLDAIG